VREAERAVAAGAKMPGADEAAERYFLLADISGYTAFLNGVERAHGVDLSGGMPAGYEILGSLLDAIVDGLRPRWEIAEIEGDAVFAIGQPEILGGNGFSILEQLRATYGAFRDARERAKGSSDHICTACPVVGNLDLKMILHRGMAVRVKTATHLGLHGPAVNVAHRLLKNTVTSRIGIRPYLLVTEAAAASFGLAAEGLAHREEYPDVGVVEARIIALA
jgi:hypothetical protein